MATEAPEAPATTKPESFLTDPKVEQDWEAAIAADRATNDAATRGEKPPDKTQQAQTQTQKPDAQKTEKTDVKPESKADAFETPPDGMSEKGKESWKNFHASKKAVEKERDEWRTKHDTATARMAELEKAAKTPAQQAKLEDNPEYQQLKALAEAREKQLEEYSEKIIQLDVQEHPRFKAHYGNLIDAQMTLAKTLAGEKAIEILQLPAGEYRDSKLEELASELSPIKAAQLGTVLARLGEIELDRASEIKKARENYQTIQAQQKEQTQKQQRAIEDTFKTVTADVMSKEKGLSVFQEREGDAEWNQGVQERLALSQATFNGKLKPEQMAQQAYWAAAAPQFLVQLNGALERNAALEKELLELRGASPEPGGKGGSDTSKGGDELPKGLDGIMKAMENEVVFPHR